MTATSDQGGFFAIDNSVIDLLPKIKPVGYAIYSYLVKMADREGCCHPSQKTIGKAVGVSDRVVRTYLTLLEAVGLVKTKRVNEGDSRGLCYIVSAPCKKRNVVAAIEEKRNVDSGNSTSSGTLVPVNSGSYVPLEQEPRNNTRPAPAHTHEAEPSCAEELFGSDVRNAPVGPPKLTSEQRRAAHQATQAVFETRGGGPTWKEWGVWEDAYKAGLRPEDAVRFAVEAKARWDRRKPDDPARSMLLFRDDIIAAVSSPHTKTQTLSAAEIERNQLAAAEAAKSRFDLRAMRELGISEREIAEMLGATA